MSCAGIFAPSAGSAWSNDSRGISDTRMIGMSPIWRWRKVETHTPSKSTVSFRIRRAGIVHSRPANLRTARPWVLYTSM